MNDIEFKSWKKVFSANGVRPNQLKSKSKGMPSLISHIKQKKLGLRETQLKILNTLWLNSGAEGIVLLPYSQLGSILRPISKNWKRDLAGLYSLYMIKYVQVRDGREHYRAVNNQAALMINPNINFSVSKWKTKIRKNLIKRSWESGLHEYDYAGL